jgi:aminoglycoside 3-N-acetyltransferase
MISVNYTQARLLRDLSALGVRKGDGLFVHCSMKAIGSVTGGPGTIVETLLEAVGETGLVGMPGFSSDAYFPSNIDRSSLTQEQIFQIEGAVLGFDALKSPTSGMGIIAEM